MTAAQSPQVSGSFTSRAQFGQYNTTGWELAGGASGAMKTPNVAQNTCSVRDCVDEQHDGRGVGCFRWLLRGKKLKGVISTNRADSREQADFKETVLAEKPSTPDDRLQQEFNRWAEQGEGEK